MWENHKYGSVRGIEMSFHGLNNVTLAGPKGARKQGKQRKPKEGKL
jgi:hypothetical protein